jgi:hypothetical protein
VRLCLRNVVARRAPAADRGRAADAGAEAETNTGEDTMRERIAELLRRMAPPPKPLPRRR